MFSALWNFFFPPERIPDPPPLQRPRKYPRTTDLQHLNNPHHDFQGEGSSNTPHDWPRYYPPQHFQPLSQSQLPYQPVPFEPQPSFNMFYSPGPQPLHWNMNRMGYLPFAGAVPPNNWHSNLPQLHPGFQSVPQPISAPPPYPPPSYSGSNQGTSSLNLNGDILEDLITGRVVSCLSDGLRALAVMFGATPFPNGTVTELAAQMLKFNRAHTIFDPEFRPPTFHREDPSIFTPTTAIPVTLTLKRKSSEKIEGERRARKAKSSKKPGIAPSKKKYGIKEPPRLPAVKMP
ncbi:hypothetical protein K438DRAFT_1979903 [Mycena galopus ATCC 62051]|nr:hypothetical protein K438DRAFT_1992035 [Mycena galopus ATCC 62051]KAF8175017.1 hypothetical protein K438DRAFT_1979903 [Mycena galopus ATCC 62051]